MWYVRVGKGARRIRIRAEFGTADFTAEYEAALSGTPRTKKGAPSIGTLAWLIDRYRETTAWSSLSLTTRRKRDNIFLHVIETAGSKPFAHITPATIMAGRERRAATPAISLTQCAGFSAGHQRPRWSRPIPRWELKTPRTSKATDSRHGQRNTLLPIRHVGLSRQRVWLDVLLYTGLRRGDAVRFGRQHVKDGIGTIKTEKSGFTLAVTIPILPVLAETLAAGPCGDLTFIAGESGRPLKKESFGNLFRDACREAGVPGSAHGVRKIAATTAANNGATVAQLEALFGWTGGAMASLYTRSANRRRLALDAASKLTNAERTSIPAPRDPVRAPERKGK